MTKGQNTMLTVGKKPCILFLAVLILVFSCNSPNSGIVRNTQDKKTIVDYFGLIHVKGNKIVDKNENPVALHGMSLFWSQWGGTFYNESCVRFGWNKLA